MKKFNVMFIGGDTQHPFVKKIRSLKDITFDESDKAWFSTNLNLLDDGGMLATDVAIFRKVDDNTFTIVNRITEHPAEHLEKGLANIKLALESIGKKLIDKE